MRNIILKYYQIGSLDLNEVVQLIEEYMNKIHKHNPKLIEYMLNMENPNAQQMLSQAAYVAIEFLEVDYSICKLYSVDNVLIKVF